ncbi:MAG: hypothetical protein ACHQQQ_13605 [Bacteroidota bacterium]
MNNLACLNFRWGGPGTPGMTQMIEITVIILGFLIIVNGIYSFFKNKTWKKLFHRNHPVIHG